CSPDGQWAAFNAIPQVLRVRLSGGSPEPLGNFVGLGGLTFAADGRTLALIADVRVPGSPSPGRKLVLITAGAAPRFVDVGENFAGGAVRFTPDGTAIAYVVKNGSAERLEAQPLDGTPTRTLASFGAGHVSGFDWSPDGATIVAL